MAKLVGPLKLRGSVGGLTFVKGEDNETYVKEKSGPRECRMKEGEEFAHSRLCNAEWKQAAQATRTFRLAMGDLKQGVEERRLAGRMNAWFLEAIRSDKVNDWGERRLQAGDLSLLEGFELNRKLALDDLLPVHLEDGIQVEDRTVRIVLPGFRLRRASKKIPEGATHFRVVSAMVYMDPDKKAFSRVVKTGELTAIGRKSGEDFVAEHAVRPAAGQLGFWLVGIEFCRLKGTEPVVVKGGVLRCIRVWGEMQGHEAPRHAPGQKDIVGNEGETDSYEWKGLGQQGKASPEGTEMSSGMAGKAATEGIETARPLREPLVRDHGVAGDDVLHAPIDGHGDLLVGLSPVQVLSDTPRHPGMINGIDHRRFRQTLSNPPICIPAVNNGSWYHRRRQIHHKY